MLKLIHTSDLHLGKSYKFLGEKSELQKEKVRRSIETVTNEAINRKVDAIVFVGDIFDSPYPSESIKLFFRDELFKLSDNNIVSVILPGNHDRVEIDSVFFNAKLFQNDPNIFVINSKLVKEVFVDRIQTSFFGKAIFNEKEVINPREIIEVVDKSSSKYKIALYHGSIGLNSQYKATDLEMNVDYVALGDWHSFLDLSTSNQKSMYSGGIEFTSFDQIGSGNVLYISIDDDKNFSFEKVQISETKFEKVTLNLTNLKSLDELNNQIKLNANNQLIKEVTLEGGVNFEFDIDEIASELSRNFLYLKIKDNTYKNIDVTMLENKYEENSVISKFISVMKTKIEENPENEKFKKALSLGIQILNKHS